MRLVDELCSVQSPGLRHPPGWRRRSRRNGTTRGKYRRSVFLDCERCARDDGTTAPVSAGGLRGWHAHSASPTMRRPRTRGVNIESAKLDVERGMCAWCTVPSASEQSALRSRRRRPPTGLAGGWTRLPLHASVVWVAVASTHDAEGARRKRTQIVSVPRGARTHPQTSRPFRQPGWRRLGGVSPPAAADGAGDRIGEIESRGKPRRLPHCRARVEAHTLREIGLASAWSASSSR